MKFRKLITTIVMTCLVFTLLISYNLNSFAKEEDDQFTVEITCGIDGYAKYNAYLPVSLHITNNYGENFEGTVRLVSAAEYTDDFIAYSKDLLLSAEESRTISLALPATSSYPTFYLVIEDASGKEIMTKKVRASLSFTQDIYVGILTQDFNSLNYLDSMPIYLNTEASYEATRIFALDETTLADTANGLDVLDIILINNFDTGMLSDAQYQSLKTWVSNGGILIVGTGTTYAKTLSLFKDDYMTGSIGTVSAADLNFNLDGYTAVKRNEPLEYDDADIEDITDVESNTEAAGETEAYSYEDMIITEETESYNVQMSSEVLDKIDSIAINMLDIKMNDAIQYPDYGCQVLPKDAGAIVLFDFDLGEEPFAGWDFNTEAIQKILSELAQNYRWDLNHYYTTETDYWSITSMLTNILSDTLPEIGSYATILLLYIAIIGPVLYLVLKKIDKRQLVWGIIPAAAIGVTAIIFLFGGNTRLKKPFLNYATILHYDNGYLVDDTYFSSTSPNNSDYSFAVGGEYQVRPVNNSYYYYNSYFYNSNTSDADISNYSLNINSQEDHTVLDVKNVRSFSTRYYSAARETNDEGSLDIDVHYDKANYKGSVTNNTNYALSNAALLVGQQIYLIGDLAAGETFELSKTADNNMSYYYYDIAYYLLPDNNTSGEADAALSARRNMLSAYINTLNNARYYSGSYSTGSSMYLLVGFTEDYEVALNTASGLEMSGNTMIAQEFTVDYTIDGITYIPNINEYAQVITGDIYFPEAYMYSDSGILSYHFDDNIIPETISVSSSGTSINEYMVSFYNPNTEAYEPVLIDDTSISGNELRQYFDSTNTLKILLDKMVPGQYNGIPLPVFSFEGRVE